MNKDKNELKEKELEAVIGGTITVNDFSAEMTASGTGDHCHFEQILCANHNMPKPSSDEKYVLSGKPTADEIISKLKS